MRLLRFEHVKLISIEEAVTLLEKSGEKARILAGGTDLLVNMRYRVVPPVWHVLPLHGTYKNYRSSMKHLTG
jgi:CO/xanthine dehydrogenase FAD-binding subunit